MILGIDEAGRGPWAGPLTVGAVVLGVETIKGLHDSKKLSKAKREQLYGEIYGKAAGIGLGWVSAADIDEIGLAAALRQATRQAVRQITAPYHEVIIDGTSNFLIDTPLGGYVTTMKKADLLVPAVSAASIVAKVSRDRYMTEQVSLYPEYGFQSHVGYGTAKHRAAIEKYGVTPLHRLSFAPLAKYRGTSSGKSESVVELRLPRTSTSIGGQSETVAAAELSRIGHTIVTRNWKTKYCEIDIVSEKDGVTYFAEVKHRRSDDGGDGLAAITTKKLSQMKFAARLYAHSNSLKDTDLRLLAVATAGDQPTVVAIVKID